MLARNNPAMAAVPAMKSAHDDNAEEEADHHDDVDAKGGKARKGRRNGRSTGGEPTPNAPPPNRVPKVKTPEQEAKNVS